MQLRTGAVAAGTAVAFGKDMRIAVDAPPATDGGEDNLIRRLRVAIRARMAEQRRVSLRAMAKVLALSPRTLQRKLAAQGTCFAQVLREERRAATLALLREGRAREVMAEALGYYSVRSVDRMCSHVRASSPVPAAGADSSPGTPQRYG